MAEMKPEEIKFFQRHGIPISEVFDATGKRRKDYQEEMRLQKKNFAFGVNPCGKGHTVKTRAGHCPQCDTARIAFQRRHEKEAYVYIAGSLGGKVLKIGFSEDPERRVRDFNAQGYGLGGRWTLLFYVRCERAGAMEHEIRKKLKKYVVPTVYDKGSVEVFTQEQVSCGYIFAREAIASVVGKNMSLSWELSDATVRFNFK